MAKITKIIAHEILDSRATPTIEATVILADGASGTFATPSGLSIGAHEAVELRDSDPKRYGGKGVLNCLGIIYNTLAPILIGKDAQDQTEIDRAMIAADGTPNKSNLGANTILSLSGAIAKAQAASLKIPLYRYISHLSQNENQVAIPTPMFNILNGGLHGGGNLDFQEYLLVTQKAAPYSKALRAGVEIYYSLKDTIISHNGLVLLGDEGGYAPALYSNVDGFKIIEEAAAKASYRLGLDVFFSMDVAANNLKVGSAYKVKDRPVPLNGADFIEFYKTLNEEYHLLSIEDPFAEDEWGDFSKLVETIGAETIIVGDDLVTTNLERLKRAIDTKAITGVIIKPNQVGTITETIEVVKVARSANIKIVASHRSGETNDDFIADFAVGIGADYAKFGAPARGERVAKYNRLLEIEHELST